MAKKGRPVRSQIRQNIVEILAAVGKGYGYSIFKIYKDIFPQVTMRVVYYHLQKGLQTQEIAIDNIQKEKGDYSWGGEAEKIYYKLGQKAVIKQDPLVKEWMEKRN